ncbi:MAG: ABC transporter transmembrane domain-containing protein, partial [Proteobacteria bacterium]|nr:ABC transporter transmembrane domain-containing protein [Pseudomonadota bacterium]
MLIRLLRTYLRPYRTDLALIVALQLVATIASLYLPSMNADIIDRGVAHGDAGYILRTGGFMLLVAGLQIGCSTLAVYVGARTAMSYARDLRAAIFHRVGEFSAREVGAIGAPSLITRTTNDVQQVTMLVLMGCTMIVMAPIMSVGGIVMALREDVTLSRLLLVSVPALAASVGIIIGRMV